MNALKSRAFVCLLSMVIISMLFPVFPSYAQSSGASSGRTGAWVDTINFSVVNTSSENDVVDQIKSGTIDATATSLGRDGSLYSTVQSDNELATATSKGLFYGLTFNTSGPVFSGTGKLNPFSVENIREAVNRLIDRNYLSTGLFGELLSPKLVILSEKFPDYVRYFDTISALEEQYKYDFSQAKAAIDTEMQTLGAVMTNGKWYYNNEPVSIIFLIRTDSDGRRLPMGDYISDQLDKVGFTVDRRYVKGSQASPIWIGSQPEEGLWNIYTCAWSSTMIVTDQGNIFQEMYSPNSAQGIPVFLDYKISNEFNDVVEKLAYNNYSTEAERDQLMNSALPLSLESSNQIWIAEGYSYYVRDSILTMSYDLASGLGGSLWPLTLRFLDQEGGSVDLGTNDLFGDPWNPVAGSNWFSDQTVITATEDSGVLMNPRTGLAMPQRIESASVTVQNGVLVRKNADSDWLTLNTADQITVPTDAWIDWDAVNQRWITVGEKYPDGLTARVKSVVVYPNDLFTTVKWHDGSPISMADFVMRMILPFDRADINSEIYDEQSLGTVEYFKYLFKGYRITSTDPLTIEYYTDATQIDAENNVYDLWPNYDYGEGAWHVMTLAYLAEKDGTLAFSIDKAQSVDPAIEQTNFVGEPSLAHLDSYLDNATYDTFVPYANVLNSYLSAGEISARRSNLKNWYAAHSHFWVGTGPFYVDTLNIVNKALTLTRNPNFPDAAGKWDMFAADPAPAELAINYTDGQPGSYFNIAGAHYPVFQKGTVYINNIKMGSVLTSVDGTFAFTLKTQEDSNTGTFKVKVKVNPTASVDYELNESSPLRSLVGTLKQIELPSIIPTTFIYIPVIQKP